MPTDWSSLLDQRPSSGRGRARPGNSRRPRGRPGKACWASRGPAASAAQALGQARPAGRRPRSTRPVGPAVTLPAQLGQDPRHLLRLDGQEEDVGCAGRLRGCRPWCGRRWPRRTAAGPRCSGSAASRFSAATSPARTIPCPSAVAICPAPISPMRFANIRAMLRPGGRAHKGLAGRQDATRPLARRVGWCATGSASASGWMPLAPPVLGDIVDVPACYG